MEGILPSPMSASNPKTASGLLVRGQIGGGVVAFQGFTTTGDFANNRTSLAPLTDEFDVPRVTELLKSFIVCAYIFPFDFIRDRFYCCS
jgi:hypothetical protein